MKKQSIQHHMDGLAALLLFGVFAACVLSVLLTGAGAYRRLTQRDQDAFSRRTCVQYLATRVRQADSRDSVSVDPDFGGVPALVLEDGYGFATWVYCYDGQLMELYAAVDSGMSPGDGAAMMPLSGLGFTLSEGLLTAVFTGVQGTEDVLSLSLRSGEGAAA